MPRAKSIAFAHPTEDDALNIVWPIAVPYRQQITGSYPAHGRDCTSRRLPERGAEDGRLVAAAGEPSHHRLQPALQERRTRLAKALAGFEIVDIMRERTPFTRALFEQLPNLKLLITTGMRNASVDVKAAADHKRDGLRHQCRRSRDRGAGLRPDPVAGAAPAHRASQHARGPLADHGRQRHARQDARPAWPRQARRRGSQVRQGVRDEHHSLEPEPDDGARHRGRRRSESRRTDLFRRADFISVHLVLSDRSRGLVSARSWP